MKPLHKLFTLLVMTGFVLVCPSTAAATSPAQIVPLAEHSLLLDGQQAGQRLVVVGERGHILISDNNGQTWRQQPVPTRSTLTSVFFLDEQLGWAAGHDAVILQTRDGGESWQQVYADPDDERPILDLWFRDADFGLAIGAYGLFLVTEDGGQHWDSLEFNPATLRIGETIQESGQDESMTDEFWPVDFHLNQLNVTPGGRLFIAAEAGNIYRSDDNSHSWLSLPSPYEGSFYGSLPLENDHLLMFGLRGHLFRSSDAGETWRELPSGTQATLNDAIRLRDGRIVLAGLAGALLISNDDGEHFSLYAQTDRAGISRVLETTDAALVLIGEQGVKRVELPARQAEVAR
jgi:photosystem II stability/assembly factor-like uncharacterized protein